MPMLPPAADAPQSAAFLDARLLFDGAGASVSDRPWRAGAVEALQLLAGAGRTLVLTAAAPAVQDRTAAAAGPGAVVLRSGLGGGSLERLAARCGLDLDGSAIFSTRQACLLAGRSAGIAHAFAPGGTATSDLLACCRQWLLQHGAARSRPVLVVGDAMLDCYWEGEVEWISPEAPVPVFSVRRAFERAGGAANVALNLAGLGQAVTLATVVGEDDAGERLQAMAQGHGVAWAGVRCPQTPTTRKVRSVCRRQQLLRIDFEDRVAERSVRLLEATVRPLLPRHPWVLLSDYGKGCLAGVQGLIAQARAAGCRVLADPKGQDFQRYRGAWLLKPNESELRQVVGAWADEADLRHRAAALREAVGTLHLLVTRGERGMLLCSPGQAPLAIAAEPREVYDVSGAGDTVIATLAHALACGLALADAARLANRAAGIVVGRFGTASVDGEALYGASAPSPPASATVSPAEVWA